MCIRDRLIPDFPKVSEFLVKHHKTFALLCVALFIPFAYFQANTKVYYNLDASLPKDLESIMANEKLQEDYHMGAAHMILMDKNVSGKEKNKMIKEMEKVDGVKEVLGLETLIGPCLLYTSKTYNIISAALLGQAVNEMHFIGGNQHHISWTEAVIRVPQINLKGFFFSE